MIALQKKEGGIRPLTVGYTLRCLVAKCANAQVIKRRSDELHPIQVGVSVSGGAEAAIHAMRRLVTDLPDDHVVVKLDFFKCVQHHRRDTVLDTVADKMPELYRFIHASLSGSPKLSYSIYIIESANGSQQGEPLSGLEFCHAVHSTLEESASRTKLGYVDDLNLERKIFDAARDVQRIINAQATTGLVLNTCKCEIVANDFNLVDKYPFFLDFKRVHKEDMTFLGGPGLQCRATDKLLQEKIADMERAIKRLALLQAHDALCLLKNSISISKLLYLLKTSPCFNNPLLASVDDTLRRGLSLVLNVELDHKQCSPATLPVHMGDLGVRSACMLAPSAFLVSVAATLPLQDAILA